MERTETASDRAFAIAVRSHAYARRGAAAMPYSEGAESSVKEVATIRDGASRRPRRRDAPSFAKCGGVSEGETREVRRSVGVFRVEFGARAKRARRRPIAGRRAGAAGRRATAAARRCGGLAGRTLASDVAAAADESDWPAWPTKATSGQRRRSIGRSARDGITAMMASEVGRISYIYY